MSAVLGFSGIEWGNLIVLVLVRDGAARLVCGRPQRLHGAPVGFLSRVAGGIVLTFSITVALTGCTTTTANEYESFHASEMTALRELRLISYFPAHSSWQYMWEDFRAGVVDQDMARIADLHANGVRIIISTVAFGFPRPHPRDLSELRDVIQTAQRNGLRVQLTLFDGFDSWQAIQGSHDWVQALLAPYAGDGEIAFIELRNEINLSNAGEMTWGRNLLSYTEKLADGVPVTVSVSNGGAAKLADLRRQLGGSKPDFWDLHYYGAPETLTPHSLQPAR